MNADDRQGAENWTTTLLAALCAGAVIGAGIALLFAPRPGYQIRRQLSRSARRAGRAASRTVSDLTERGLDAYESARDGVTHASDEIERVATQASKQIDKGLTAVRDLASAM